MIKSFKSFSRYFSTTLRTFRFRQASGYLYLDHSGALCEETDDWQHHQRNFSRFFEYHFRKFFLPTQNLNKAHHASLFSPDVISALTLFRRRLPQQPRLQTLFFHYVYRLPAKYNDRLQSADPIKEVLRILILWSDETMTQKEVLLYQVRKRKNNVHKNLF